MALRHRHERAEGDGDPAALAALADESLPPEEREALGARVAGSDDLAALLDEQQRAVSLFRSAAAEVEAPSSLRRGVDAQERARARRARSRGRFVVAGAAVAAVIVVAAGIALRGGSSSGQQFHAALGATPLSPGAGGSATLTKTTSGWRIDLDATGLRRLDEGRFYEAWLKNAVGTLVPIGTFNEGRNVTLWAGVSPKDFPTLTVTRERDDGDQASSGQKVLVGTVDTSG
jgi:hypothetical protein